MESLVICPSKLHITEVYSTGWEFEEDFEESSSEEGFSVVIESSVVDRIQIRDHKRDSALKIESLVKKNKKKVSLEDETMMHGLMDRGRCDEFCPEINGCISPLLWCDGQVHCLSSGSDESEEHYSDIHVVSSSSSSSSSRVRRPQYMDEHSLSQISVPPSSFLKPLEHPPSILTNSKKLNKNNRGQKMTGAEENTENDGNICDIETTV
ncbi:unnamed protein product [Lepeophtheirus salmonis]|uniref:(salmon louse) hypothetical protein n=1 Tax=Lepeophtheirus salmonis TaxID=72036 RepID=A0A7R8GZL8_LEPSM|nr:unnamed protein product [Lepeophtheirus salmonis]CAF2755569.1 unnamed protein product [Lepeophtheirus salmonis]